MKIKNKLTNRVYRAHKVLLVIDGGISYGAYLPKQVIESLILSFIELMSDYDELC